MGGGGVIACLVRRLNNVYRESPNVINVMYLCKFPLLRDWLETLLVSSAWSALSKSDGLVSTRCHHLPSPVSSRRMACSRPCGVSLSRHTLLLLSGQPLSVDFWVVSLFPPCDAGENRPRAGPAEGERGDSGVRGQRPHCGRLGHRRSLPRGPQGAGHTAAVGVSFFSYHAYNVFFSRA